MKKRDRESLEMELNVIHRCETMVRQLHTDLSYIYNFECRPEWRRAAKVLRWSLKTLAWLHEKIEPVRFEAGSREVEQRKREGKENVDAD